MDDQLKYKILSQLDSGVAPLQIADDFDVTYAAVLKFKRQHEEAKLNGTVDKLLDFGAVAIQEVVESLPEDLPTAEVVQGITGLERLQDDLQVTARAVIKQTNKLVLLAEDVNELSTAADILCTIQNAFFNKNSTQVNVQNNFGGDNGGAKRYGHFLTDVPVN